MNDKLLELVQRSMRGDSDAFEQLCNTKAQDILYICVKVTGSLEQGQDAAQEVLLSMQDGIRRLQNADAFLAWLNRIISRTCMRQLARERTGDIPLDEYEVQESNLEFLPSEYTESREKQALVLEALQALPAKNRHILMLFYYEDLSLKEIALALDISHDAARAALSRARKRLKRQIELQGGETIASAGGLAALPALSIILHNDAAQMATEQSATALLAAAGIGAGSAGALAAGTHLSALALPVLFVAVGATVTVGGVILASSPSSPQGPPSSSLAGVPQHPASETASSGLPEQEPLWDDEGVLNIDGSSFVLQPDSSTYSDSIPEDPQPGQEAFAQGTVTFVDSAGAPIPGVDLSGITVQLWQGGSLRAEARVSAGGGYALPTGQISDGAYEIRLVQAGPYGLSLLAADADGERAIRGEGAATRAPSLRVTDTQAPVAGITFYSAAGEELRGNANPQTITLSVWDASPVSAEWAILGPGGETLHTGSGLSLQPQPISGAGRYTVQFTVTDAAGNSTTLSRPFRVSPA